MGTVDKLFRFSEYQIIYIYVYRYTRTRQSNVKCLGLQVLVPEKLVFSGFAFHVTDRIIHLRE